MNLHTVAESASQPLNHESQIRLFPYGALVREQPERWVTLWTGNMGDSFPGLFRFAAPRPGRRKAAKLSGPAIDDAAVEIGKAHDPVAGRGFGDSDLLAGEGLTDED